MTWHVVAGFCAFLRKNGFTVGIAETLDAIEVARLVLCDLRAFRAALCSLLCGGKDDADRFDKLFDTYWFSRQTPRHTAQSKVIRPGMPKIPILAIAARANEAEPGENEGMGASAAENLRTMDFAKAPLKEIDDLEAFAARLFRLMSLRLSRQLKSTMRKDRLDLRRTIRCSISQGGTPIRLAYRTRRPRRPHLAALLDVSASMDRYSFFLLQFLHALEKHFRRVDSFLFSTRLHCISTELRAHQSPAALATLAEKSGAFRGGTRIGESLQAFNDEFGRRMLSKNTVVLILSDGLDTGEPDLLARQVRVIQRRSRRLFWLSPLLGMEGYEPRTRGIRSVLPYVDELLPAHNIESLLRLETHLRHA